MKRYNIAAVVCVCVGASSSVMAQVNMDQCVALANVISVGEYVQFSNHQLEALQYYSRCETHSSQQEGALDIAYGAFSFGASGSGADSSGICEQSRDTLNISNVDYVSAKQLFDSTLSTVEKCIAAAKNGWDVEVTPITPDAVSINVSNNFPRGAQLEGVDILPVGSMDCKGAPAEFPMIVTTTEYMSMICTREPVVSDAGGVPVTTSRDATINIRLSDISVPVHLPGYSGSIIDPLKADIGELQARLAQNQQATEASIGNLGSRLRSWGPDSTGGIKLYDTQNFRQPNLDSFLNFTQACPEGQYMVGLKIYTTQHGECRGCLGGSELICRPLGIAN